MISSSLAEGLLHWLWETTWQSTLLVVLILTVQMLFRRHLSPQWRCAMWGLLLIRLALPGLPESEWSIRGLFMREAAPTPVLASLKALEAPVERDFPVAPITSITIVPDGPTYRIDWLIVLAGVWAIGAIILFTRAMRSNGQFRSRVSTTTAPAAADIVHTASELSRSLRLRQVPSVITTSAVSVPSVFGVFRPMLLLPPCIEQTLSPTELRFVILHELMHIKRRDVLMGMTLAAFNAIHWFNPVLWLAAARYRLDREMACDAAILAGRDRASRQTYAETILKILESFTPTRSPLAAVAVLESRSSIHHRLSAITRPAKGSLFVALGATISVGVIGCAAFTKPPGLKKTDGMTASTADMSQERNSLTSRTYSVLSIRDMLVVYERWNLDSPVFAITKTPTPGDDAARSNLAPPVPGDSGQLRGSTQPGPRSAIPATQPRDPQTVVADLMKYIEPATWKARHGTGTAELRDGQVVIQQSTTVHDKIQSMIKFVGRQILVETRFVTAPQKSIEWERSHKDGWATYGELLLWARPLEDADVSQILRELQKSQKTTTLTAPRLTLFNGQSANVVVATETAYVKDLIPGLGSDQLTFDPVIGVATSGVSLECAADIALDGQSVVLHLKPKLQRLKAMTPHPVSATWQDGKISQAFIQVPHMEVLEFDRTFRVPSDRTLLIKMGSIVPQLERKSLLGSRLESDDQHMYLLVSATILPPENPQ